MEYTGRIVFLDEYELIVKHRSLDYAAFTMSKGLSTNVNSRLKVNDLILVETRKDNNTIAKAVVLKERV